MFYVAAAGHHTREFSSMIRFALCVQVMLALAIVHLVAHTRAPRLALNRVGRGALILWFAACMFSQFALTYRFTHGRWVG
jgi:hypothetical protein